MHTTVRHAVALALLCTPGIGQSSGWPTWRGPTGNGVAAPGAAPPLEWSEQENVRWKVELPGLGASTPILVRGRLYLTCAVPLSGEPLEEGAEVPPPPRVPHRLLVCAYDPASGNEVWRTSVKEVTPHEKLHKTSSLASASVVSDGERLYAFFGSHGMYALDLEGEILWSRDLGRMKTLAEFGEGATPALHDGTLVVPWDHEGDSSVIGLDATSGEVRWRTPRDCDSSWGSPVVVRTAAGAQAIVTGSDATHAYDLKDGSLVWSCAGMSKNPVNSATAADGVVYVMNSYKGKVVQALRPDGGQGEGEDRVLWAHTKSAAYVPNPVVTGGLLFFLRDSVGVLNCLDAKTGEERFYGERIDGVRAIHASPVVAAGRIYIASRNGAVAIVKAAAEFELLGVNELDDCFDATPVVVGETLFLRGRRNLYCVAEEK